MLAEFLTKLEQVAEKAILYDDPDRRVVRLPNGALHTIEKPTVIQGKLGGLSDLARYVVDNTSTTANVFVNKADIFADLAPDNNVGRSAVMALTNHAEQSALLKLNNLTPAQLFALLNTTLKGCFDEALAMAVGSVKIKREQHVSVTMTGGGKAGKAWRIECGEDGGTTLPSSIVFNGRMFNEWPKTYTIECALFVDENGVFTVTPLNVPDVLNITREDIAGALGEQFESHPNIHVYLGGK